MVISRAERIALPGLIFTTNQSAAVLKSFDFVRRTLASRLLHTTADEVAQSGQALRISKAAWPVFCGPAGLVITEPKNLPFATSRRLLAELCKFLVARTAGAKVIQPLLDICEPQLAESDASKNCRVTTSHALWIWKLTRETSR